MWKSILISQPCLDFYSVVRGTDYETLTESKVLLTSVYDDKYIRAGRDEKFYQVSNNIQFQFRLCKGLCTKLPKNTD